MRTNLNLATQPYEDARQYLVRWGALVALAFVVTVGLVLFTVHSVRRSSGINHQLAEARRNISRLDGEKELAEKMLAMPQNRDTVEKSEFLNGIFARKSFSWTTVFSDMEKLMPPGLHVVAISPELDEQNEVQVHILVGGESRDRALELVRGLETTPRFRDVILRSDTTNQNPITGQRLGAGPSGENDLIKFDIVALYLPSAPHSAAPAQGLANASAEPSTVAENGGKP